MDIRHWNANQIMQLPDWAFGDRWWVGEYMGSTTGVAYYRGGEEILPDPFILWGLLISSRSPACTEAIRLTIRLAGIAVTADVQAKKLPRLLDGISIADIVYELYVSPNGTTWIGNIRKFVQPNGKKLSLVSSGDQSNAYEMTVGILVSAIPKEVPDWLLDKNVR